MILFILQRVSGPVQFYSYPLSLCVDQTSSVLRCRMASNQIARQIRQCTKRFNEPVTLIFLSDDDVFNTNDERVRWGRYRIIPENGGQPSWRSWLRPAPRMMKYFLNHKTGNWMERVKLFT